MGRSAVVTAVAVAIMVAPAADAPARAAEPWSPADATPLTANGVTLGSIVERSETTAEFDGTGPCTDAEHPSGYPHAATFSIAASSVKRLLSLQVADDLEGSLSLCRLDLYAATSGGQSLADPFNASQRETFLRAHTAACSTASSCGLSQWLSTGHAYYVVAWAAPPTQAGNSGPDEATFEVSGSIRRQIAISLSVRGHRIREGCSDYHEVVNGRSFTMRASTSPDATGTARFWWYGWDGNSWELLAKIDRSLSGGDAELTLRAGSSGKRLVRASFLGSSTMLPATSAQRKIAYVSPRWRRYADGGLRLSVPWYRQQLRLSCEAASLRMAHNYFHPGRIDYDSSVHSVIGIDRRLPARTGGCDPDRWFCGNPNGTMMADGYGVHYAPIARAATYYDSCRPGLSLVAPGYTTLTKHLASGYPIVVWGAHRGPSGIYRVTWTAWTGNSIVAYSVEHTWTLIGWRGPASDPTHFIIHDPSRSTGGTRTISTASFYSFFKYFKRAVVVRG